MGSIRITGGFPCTCTATIRVASTSTATLTATGIVGWSLQEEDGQRIAALSFIPRPHHPHVRRVRPQVLAYGVAERSRAVSVEHVAHAARAGVEPVDEALQHRQCVVGA